MYVSFTILSRQETSYTVSDPSNPEYYGSSSSEERMDIVELLEAIAYLICQDDPIRPETFHRIISSRGVPGKILRLADKNRDGVVSVEEMMNFILTITNPRWASASTSDKTRRSSVVSFLHCSRQLTRYYHRFRHSKWVHSFLAGIKGLTVLVGWIFICS